MHVRLRENSFLQNANHYAQDLLTFEADFIETHAYVM